MAKVEIDEAELANLRAGYGLINRLHADPKTSQRVRQAIADIDPDLKLPDPPVAAIVHPLERRVESLAESVEKVAKTVQDDLDARKNRAEDDTLAARIRAAAERHGFNEEGRKLITERLIAQQSLDVEGAAALIAADNPKPKPMPASNFPRLADPFGVRGSDDEDLKMLHTNPDQWQQNMIEQLVAESGMA